MFEVQRALNKPEERALIGPVAHLNEFDGHVVVSIIVTERRCVVVACVVELGDDKLFLLVFIPASCSGQTMEPVVLIAVIILHLDDVGAVLKGDDVSSEPLI